MIEKNESMNNIDQLEKKYLKGGETKIMSIKKKAVAVLSTTALLASLATPVFADSENFVKSQPSIADDYKSEPIADNSPVYNDPLTYLYLKEDNVPFENGEIFRITLPEGVKFVEEAYNASNTSLSDHLKKARVVNISDQTLELEITGLADNTNVGDDTIQIPLFVEVDGATGELQVTVEPFDTTLTGGKYTFAVVGSGNTTTTIEEVKTIGEKGTLGTIRIDENSVNAVGNDAQEITLTLPSDFEWDGVPTIQFSAGFAGTVYDDVYKGVNDGTYYAFVEDEKLTIKFNPKNNRTQRGTIYIKNAVISAVDDDAFGDIELNIDGDEVTNQDIIVAKYADFGVNVSAGDAPELVAGKYEDNDDLKAAKITIKEDVAGSIVTGRKTTIKLPSGVKVKKAELKDASEVTLSGSGLSINKDRDEVEFVIDKLSSKADFGIQLYLSIEPDFTGDIVAEVSGRAGIEGEVTIAKAISPVNVETTPTNVEIGVKEQKLNDIVITESVKGALKKGKVTITLPDGLRFSNEPKVEVLEGNIKIDEDVDLAKYDNDSDRQLVITVESASTKPSKIKISGASITLDRTIPVGPIEAKVGGDFIENYTTDDSKDTDKFEEDSATKVVVANVVTPAPATTKLVFTIGSKDYTVNSETKTFEVAPFIDYATERTYLPVRAVAEALGASIYYDDATRTVTLIKDGKAIVYKNGGNSVNIAGTEVPVKVINKEGYTFLPFRLLAEALGAKVEWDATNRQVIVTQ